MLCLANRQTIDKNETIPGGECFGLPSTLKERSAFHEFPQDPEPP